MGRTGAGDDPAVHREVEAEVLERGADREQERVDGLGVDAEEVLALEVQAAERAALELRTERLERLAARVEEQRAHAQVGRCAGGGARRVARDVHLVEVQRVDRVEELQQLGQRLDVRVREAQQRERPACAGRRRRGEAGLDADPLAEHGQSGELRQRVQDGGHERREVEPVVAAQRLRDRELCDVRGEPA